MVSQTPPNYSRSTALPPETPPAGMPRFIAHDNRHAQQPPYYEPQLTEAKRSWAEALYDMLWPVTSWSVTLFNLTVMGTTISGMLNNYNAWTHAAATAITVFSLGALAIIYRWVLNAPSRYQPQIDVPSSN